MAESTIHYAGPLVSRKEAKLKSLKRYFSGVPCIRGHISERNTQNTHCLVCSRLKANKKYARILTHERLLQLLDYCPETGIFSWKVSSVNQTKAGYVAGHIDSNGYRTITIDGNSFKAHQLAIFFVTKQWPKYEVDHKNRTRGDNTWRNIRCATYTQNQANKPPTRNNKSGFKGVFWEKNDKRWAAKIYVNRKAIDLGRFKNKLQAAVVYNQAAQKYFGEFGWLNPIP